jgi:hypothetical protein
VLLLLLRFLLLLLLFLLLLRLISLHGSHWRSSCMVCGVHPSKWRRGRLLPLLCCRAFRRGGRGVRSIVCLDCSICSCSRSSGSFRCCGPYILKFVCVHAWLLCWWGCARLQHKPVTNPRNRTLACGITCSQKPCKLICACLKLQ